MGIVDRLAEAQSLLDEGEQGAARVVLASALADAGEAWDSQEALAIAEATGLLIELDLGIEPDETIDAHLDRMEALTRSFDDAETAEARAAAELQRIEFVHGLDELDPVLHVEVLRRALDADARLRGSAHVGVRRAAAEAAITAQMIRRWLGQDPGSIAVALDELAVRLGGEDDPRLATIRADAMLTSSRLRIENHLDLTGVPEVLQLVVRDAGAIPDAVGFSFEAALLLADLAIADGVPALEAVAPARALLSDERGIPAAPRARLETRQLRRILDRLDASTRDAVAADDWHLLFARYSEAADADARTVVLSDLLGYVGPTAEVTASGLALLRAADLAFLADADPSSALARFGVAARIAGVLGHPDGASADRDPRRATRDPADAVRRSIEVEGRFAAFWTDVDTVPMMAALVLERALRLSDVGQRDAALAALTQLRERVSATGIDTARLERSQAAYWTGRFLREAGEIEASRRAIDEALREFAADPSEDVRLWAANALVSAWRSDRTDDAESEALRGVFAEWFGDDPFVGIRRIDATRRLSEAVVAHEKGDSARAVSLLGHLTARFAADEDDDIRDTVRLASENLRILSTSGAGAAAGADATTTRYRSLRDRLYAADEHAGQGRMAEAEQAWRAVIDETAGTDDVDVAMLRLAALDAWAGWLQDAGYWEQVAALARQAIVIRPGADTRAARVRVRAHFRLGLALGSLSDPRGAVAAYDALETLAATTSDADISVTRQQAAYNRAIMIDELGDHAAALAAYEQVIAVHGQALDSPSGRLRCAKALRNQALIFTGLGRIAESAGAHRRVIDLGDGSVDPELIERVKKSAFDLAANFSALGDHASAAGTYTWILTAAHLGISPTERRTAARAEKSERRQAR